MIDQETKQLLEKFQKNEITEHFVYKTLSNLDKGKNKETLKKISDEELEHYHIWRKYTGKDITPNKSKIFKYLLLSKLLGLTFTVKLMEKGESHAQEVYSKITKIPEAKSVLSDEKKHEKSLVNLIDEEKLRYVGSIVLGLNDALVELTGTIAGLTFALQNAKLVGMAAAITGVAATLSMSASEYLSKKSEGEKKPFKASFYTGIAYMLTVLILVLPFLIISSHYIALCLTLAFAVLIILAFTYFISVCKDLPFGKRFGEMALISLGVAAVSFLIGLALRAFLGVEA